MAELANSGRAPSLFWFETRNLFVMAERRGRLQPGEAATTMAQLRDFPILDEGTGNDRLVLALADVTDCPAMTRAISRCARRKVCRSRRSTKGSPAPRAREGVDRARTVGRVMTHDDDFAIDALAGFLPMAARDRLAETLTPAEIETLTHLAKTGTGPNSLRALASDLAYLEAWARASTGRALVWPASETTVLRFVAHHLWDEEEREKNPEHGMPRRSPRTCAPKAA